MKNIKYLITTIITVILLVSCDNSQNPKNGTIVRKTIQWENTGICGWYCDVSYIVKLKLKNSENTIIDTLNIGESFDFGSIEYQIFNNDELTNKSRNEAIDKFCDNIEKIEVTCYDDYFKESAIQWYYATLISDYTSIKSIVFDLSRYNENDTCFCMNLSDFTFAEIEIDRNGGALEKFNSPVIWHNQCNQPISVYFKYGEQNRLRGLVIDETIQPDEFLILPEYVTYTNPNIHSFLPLDQHSYLFGNYFKDSHLKITCGDITYDSEDNDFAKSFFLYSSYKKKDDGLHYYFTEESFK